MKEEGERQIDLKARAAKKGSGKEEKKKESKEKAKAKAKAKEKKAAAAKIKAKAKAICSPKKADQEGASKPSRSILPRLAKNTKPCKQNLWHDGITQIPSQGNVPHNAHKNLAALARTRSLSLINGDSTAPQAVRLGVGLQAVRPGETQH